MRGGPDSWGSWRRGHLCARTITRWGGLNWDGSKRRGRAQCCFNRAASLQEVEIWAALEEWQSSSHGYLGKSFASRGKQAQCPEEKEYWFSSLGGGKPFVCAPLAYFPLYLIDWECIKHPCPQFLPKETGAARSPWNISVQSWFIP